MSLSQQRPGPVNDRSAARAEVACARLTGQAAPMTVKRIVPDLAGQSLEDAKRFYELVFGLRPVMDHGWIVTLADPSDPSCHISLMSHDETAPVVPEVSIQVDDVDAAYVAVLQTGSEIVHPLTDEPWGVRRFFVRDPNGHVLNVLSHA